MHTNAQDLHLLSQVQVPTKRKKKTEKQKKVKKNETEEKKMTIWVNLQKSQLTDVTVFIANERNDVCQMLSFVFSFNKLKKYEPQSK